MITLVSFGDKRYAKSKNKLAKSALKFGVDKIIFFDELTLFQYKDFIFKNQFILRQKRGYGYWLWKPFIINTILNSDEFQKEKDNILFYCDTGVEIIAPIEILTKNIQKSILTFYINHINLHYVKRIIYEKIEINTGLKNLTLKEEEILRDFQYANQIAGGYIFFKNDDFSRKFVKEWLSLCENPFLIDDSPIPSIPEFDEFIDNRHDQAILSMIVKKYNIQTMIDPSQYAMKHENFKKEDFVQIFNLHKKRIHPIFGREKFPFQKLWKNINSQL